MEVRKARPEELDAIMRIYRCAQDFMIRSGNPTQWAHSYPTEQMVRDDIARGACRVLLDEDRICGVFALFDGVEPNYLQIVEGAWLNDAPYLTIHRVAGDGTVHGVFRCVAEYCKGLGRDLRIDTHEKNIPMQRQILKNGFVRCGIIHVLDGDLSPRIAYQWCPGGGA